ncbi:MAG: hypothetical protein HQ567_23270 [Candidatus Nealsonbacteria bacterium]|nr:hypothetical protein [Candidatus Nealsonbacteria bacterium]
MRRSKGVRVTVLVEDRALERLAREVLYRLGFARREVYVEGYPVGRGSAKQWVEKQYPGKVRTYRSKASFQQIAMLVGTDADEQTVKHHFDCLDSALKDAKLTQCGDDERIVIWVPKWNVETWMLHLCGEDVDEMENYKNKLKNPDFAAIAKCFVDRFHTSGSGSSGLLPSLQVALKETARLDL